MGRIDQLRNAGLLNEATNYDDMTGSEFKLKRLGFCTSHQCNGNRLNRGIPRFDTFGRSECPECEHALKYKMVTYQQYENLKARYVCR